MITLLDDNRTRISEEAVTFDDGSYHFLWNGLDITDLISRNDKIRIVPGFDVEKENLRLSRERGAGNGAGSNEPLSESTVGALYDQVTNDGVLKAPLESLDNAVEQVFSSTGVKVALTIAGIVLLVMLTSKEK